MYKTCTGTLCMVQTSTTVQLVSATASRASLMFAKSSTVVIFVLLTCGLQSSIFLHNFGLNFRCISPNIHDPMKQPIARRNICTRDPGRPTENHII